MVSSNAARSQSNIYIDDPDSYLDERETFRQSQNVQNLSSKYAISEMNMPSMFAGSTTNNGLLSSHGLKNATSMQQLQSTNILSNKIMEQQTVMMDQDQPEEQNGLTNSTLSIPEVFQQQLMNERLMCIQQMLGSGQNLSSMFNDDPHFAQQLMAYLSSGDFYQQDNGDPEVIEIMDE